ncbi:MAG TPA: DUF4258 domain-containing protein [Anaerolineales bacterium]|nr:DUF4258 domain-containing protein [Anaerolineales bacterium]
MNHSEIFFRIHAVQRMFERGISEQRVLGALKLGETIEDYSSEMHEPSRLILGFLGNRPIHVVASENPETKEITIITVYVPNPDKWSKDFKSRRS